MNPWRGLWIGMLWLSGWLGAQDPGLDLLLRCGSVLDGSGQAARRLDLGIRAERIAALGDLSALHAVRELDCSGRVVAPEIGRAHV